MTDPQPLRRSRAASIFERLRGSKAAQQAPKEPKEDSTLAPPGDEAGHDGRSVGATVMASPPSNRRKHRPPVEETDLPLSPEPAFYDQEAAVIPDPGHLPGVHDLVPLDPVAAEIHRDLDVEEAAASAARGNDGSRGPVGPPSRRPLPS